MNANLPKTEVELLQNNTAGVARLSRLACSLEAFRLQPAVRSNKGSNEKGCKTVTAYSTLVCENGRVELHRKMKFKFLTKNEPGPIRNRGCPSAQELC